MKMKTILAVGALITLAAAPLTTSAADDEADRWQLITAPFLWGSSIEGDVNIRGTTVEIDLGFEDILDATKYGFQTYIELRKKMFGFYAAPSFLKLEADAETASASAQFEQDFWLVEGGGFLNLANKGGDTPFTLDLMAGVRYWNVDTDVNIQGAGPMGRDLAIGSTFEVIDPVVGVRFREYLTPKLSISVRGDVGGFGISEGETSNFSWQAIGLLGYDLSAKFTIFAGYRALGIDADEGSGARQRNLDVIFQGILLGLQVRW